jgi:hypothetical protein
MTRRNTLPRRPLLVGANPAVQLFDDTGACTAYASCWRIDWSPHGSGTAIVLWEPGGVVVHGIDEALGHWLADHFVRHFPEFEGLRWHPPRTRRETIHLEVSLAAGMRARSGDLTVTAADVLDRRAFSTDAFPLAGVDHGVHLVLGPCGSGTITVRGRRLPGTIRRSGTPEHPSSSAFVTEAEVWQV